MPAGLCWSLRRWTSRSEQHVDSNVPLESGVDWMAHCLRRTSRPTSHKAYVETPNVSTFDSVDRTLMGLDSTTCILFRICCPEVSPGAGAPVSPSDSTCQHTTGLACFLPKVRNMDVQGLMSNLWIGRTISCASRAGRITRARGKGLGGSVESADDTPSPAPAGARHVDAPTRR